MSSPTPHAPRRRLVRPLLAAALVLGCAMPVVSMSAVPAAPAAAAPGSPGVPNDPARIFSETFENVATPGQPEYLDDYVGPAPLAMTYTAHPAWISGPACNGVIASYNSVVGGTCSASIFNGYSRTMAKAIGDRFGGGRTNHAITDATVAGYPAPSTPAATLETARPIPLSVSNRFIAFSLDVAVTNCGNATPRLRFFLLNGAQAVTLNDVAINPCTLPGGQNVVVDGRTIRVGSFATDSSLLFSGSELGIRLTNDQTSGSGNDYAIDNIRVLDATPQLDKDFESRDGSFYVGETAELTFTVTNTSELAEKSGWEFTDELPDGLEVAGPAATTCATGDITAVDGGTSIAVRNGGIASGVRSCTIKVPVRADEPGTFTNGPANVRTVGLDEPGSSVVTFLDPDPSMTLDKEGDLQDANDNGVADPGERIDYSFTVTNTGNTPLTGVRITDSRISGTTPVSQNVPIGGIRSFAATYTVTQADVDAGSVPNTATATATGPLGGRVGSNEARDVVPTPDRDPRLRVEKTAALDDTNGNDVADVGEQITYSFAVTNTGNVTVEDVAIDDSRIAGTTPSRTTLAPGESRTFVSAPYVVTQRDVNTGQVYNAATAVGTSPLGPVRSAPDEERVDTPDPDPGLALEKAGDLAEDLDGDDRADVGDTVGYTFRVRNTGNVDLVDVTVDDPRVASTDPASVSIPAGETRVLRGSYVVTQDDVDAGVVRNTALATGVYAGPDGRVDVESPPDTDEVLTPTRDPALTVVKDGVLDDENGNDRADVGESVDYSFVVTNTGNTTLENVRVQDERVRGLSPASVTLAPGASRTFTAASYEVTQADVDAGVVPNSATARGNIPGGEETTSEPDTDEVAAALADPSLVVEKTATLLDLDGNERADVGEQIEYSFSVTNDGNVTMHDVAVRDDRIEGTLPEAIDALAPGATVELVAEPYTVTAEDVEAGEVLNVATAIGAAPGSDEVMESDPDEVTTPVTAPAPGEEDPDGDGGAEGDAGGDAGGSGAGGLPETGAPMTAAALAGLLAGALVLIASGALLVRRRSKRAVAA